MTDLDAALRSQLRATLDATPWTQIDGRIVERYDGKVRDCYIDNQRGERTCLGMAVAELPSRATLSSE